jgi:Tol biopolymer transport system component/PKD repeat protein
MDWGVRVRRVVAIAVIGLVVPAAASAAPATTIESVASNGGPANDWSDYGTISANGRWVAFDSLATNLVAGDTNAFGDIFLRDRLTGETQRIDVGPGGVQTDSPSDFPEISADGRYVVFLSGASTLVPGAGSGQRIYRYDRLTNSLMALPLPSGETPSLEPSISADGSRVAFAAYDGARINIFWWDASTGAVTLVTAPPGGGSANGDSELPSISADGHWVAFVTAATNLAGADNNSADDIVEADLDTGAMTRVSVGAGGGEANGPSDAPSADADGCVVAFTSSATNLVAGDQGATPKVFVRDRCNGDTELVSVTNGGTQLTDPDSSLGISDDGCRVVFVTRAGTTPPPQGAAGVERDRCAGATSRLDVDTAGDISAGYVDRVAISHGSGRYVTITSAASDLVANDTNGDGDVFVRDLDTNTPPVAALSLSASGLTVTADASGSSDPDGFRLTTSIDFGDGSAPQTVVHAVHTYAAAGTYAVVATVTDADGASTTKVVSVTVSKSSTGGGPGGGPGVGALTLDRVKLSRSRFVVVAPGSTVGGGHGSSLTVRLSAAATATLAFARIESGRRVHGRCAAGVRRGRRCTAYVTAGTITRSLPAGTSTIALTGAVGRHRLKPGRYRLTVSARTAAGTRSSTRTLTFTILAPKRKSGGKAG